MYRVIGLERTSVRTMKIQNDMFDENDKKVIPLSNENPSKDVDLERGAVSKPDKFAFKLPDMSGIKLPDMSGIKFAFNRLIGQVRKKVKK